MEISFKGRRLVAGLVVTMLVVAACSSGGATSAPSAAESAAPSTGGESAAPSESGGQIGGQLNVWTAWGGQELTAYQAVLQPFIDQTGIQVNLLTIRDQ
ncbi:MAG TPA: hypothetical protein VFW02_01495, partial [Candidatus Limnocylindrales bacterium]|nr:hypothetical protein [Candidatus Limnocylindrales bacterium]